MKHFTSDPPSPQMGDVKTWYQKLVLDIETS